MFYLAIKFCACVLHLKLSVFDTSKKKRSNGSLPQCQIAVETVLTRIAVGLQCIWPVNYDTSGGLPPEMQHLVALIIHLDLAIWAQL